MKLKTKEREATNSAAITVAVVDDDEEVRESLANWISNRDGFVCVGSYPDAESALLRLVESPPNVVLVDINLPGLSGIECVRALKPRFPDTQFVMITAYDDSDHVFEALSAGATGYILKSESLEELLASLADVHAGGSPMSSSIARKVVQLLQRSALRLDPSDKLSKRENEVLIMLAKGYRYREIAAASGIGVETVNTYVRRIYRKLQVHTRSQAVALWANFGSEVGP